MSLAYWLNTAWMWKCAAEAPTFARMNRHVAPAQAQVLQSILHRNRATWFGSKHGFSHLSTPDEFQRRVPLSTYDDYAEPIRRIAAGEENVLTHERVLLLEPTSGSTGGEKLIPYTASLRRQFQRALAVWIADLFRARPAVRAGRAYWSISPVLGPRRRSPGGIPIGFDSDAAYLGRLERLALDRLLIMPPEVARIQQLDAFRYVTLLVLIQAEDLALISVWSPTFLTALLSALPEWHDRLCHDLRHGTIDPPSGKDPRLLQEAGVLLPLRRRMRPNPRRAELLASLHRSGAKLPEIVVRLWPRLALISCWTDAAAARFVPEVRALFPHVEIQAKGLLATEGCISFPLVGRPAPALALASHFFEFQEGQGGRCRLAHELDQGGRYRVILTTAGGLYRYQLQDEVEVAGFENQCPLIRFLGKADCVSDLVGEKLAEPHVRTVVDRICSAHCLAARFALLVPVLADPPRYRLYLQGPDLNGAHIGCARSSPPPQPVTHGAPIKGEGAIAGSSPSPLVGEGWGGGYSRTVHGDIAPGSLVDLAEALQRGLESNPHYRYAVQLGQLGRAEVKLLDPYGEPGERIVERRRLECGQKAGAIKPAVLDSWTGWPERFRQAMTADRTPAALHPIPAGSR